MMGGHVGSCCALSFLLRATTEEGGEIGSVGVAQRGLRASPWGDVTLASSCRGRSKLSRTYSVWKRTLALDQVLVQERHHLSLQLRPLRRHLRWRHRPLPRTDLPLDAFSTWRWTDVCYNFSLFHHIWFSEDLPNETHEKQLQSNVMRVKSPSLLCMILHIMSSIMNRSIN